VYTPRIRGEIVRSSAIAKLSGPGCLLGSMWTSPTSRR
jgi:hypothetical protein